MWARESGNCSGRFMSLALPPFGAACRREISVDQLRLHHFAGRRHRHVRHDGELLWPGEFGKLTLGQECLELIETQRRAVLEDHKARGALAQYVVGDGSDRHLRDGRMASDRDLHVDRIEFYATAVDQLLGAAAKE